jgi:hypothetical protein
MADQQDRPEPDHSEDPRRKEVGEGGYPEEGPPGAVSPDEPRERRGEEGETETGDAPGTSAPSDSPPGTATGNRDAAGG